MKRKLIGALAALTVFAVGMLTGIFIHYTLHRLILSTEPFIYVIF
jgi:hypothetical protein